MTKDRAGLEECARAVVEACAARDVTLGTCESLTGGGIACAVTSVAGSSAIFRGALVTYASDLKVSLANVDAGWVQDQGVYNERTAREMAAGARRVLGTDLAVSCTGVAGPQPQDGHRPGYVWIAVAGREQVWARELALHGDRSRVREQTVVEALRLVLDVCSSSIA